LGILDNIDSNVQEGTSILSGAHLNGPSLDEYAVQILAAIKAIPGGGGSVDLTATNSKLDTLIASQSVLNAKLDAIAAKLAKDLA